MGQLIPCFFMDVVPGDSIDCNSAMVLRMAPMVAPLMHQVTAYMHFFHVPDRLVWDNAELFYTGGDEGTDAPVRPYSDRQVNASSLQDYFGLPVDATNQTYRYQAIPLAAYNLIWNEYYRDQNLQDPIDATLGDGSNSNVWNILRRAWQHDYFTSCLPTTQKGPDATIPLGTVEPAYLDTSRFITSGSNIGLGTQNTIEVLGEGTDEGNVGSTHAGPWADGRIENLASMSVSPTTIIDLRNAFALQHFLELNNRGGTRYTELILSHFGVKSSDARLQRPEFLGGGKVPISMSEVLQTSTTTGSTTPQGNMAGHGIGAGQGSSWTYRSEEHGVIIGILSVMPKTGYFQGVPRYWKKFDKYDYFWPAFQNIGEQPVYNYEVYQDEADPENSGTFGYIPRYAEYKYINDTVSGKFRTDLDFWHMARKFLDRPLLNENFIECDPTTRIFANEQGEQLYITMGHKVRARRPMQFYGNPKII